MPVSQYSYSISLEINMSIMARKRGELNESHHMSKTGGEKYGIRKAGFAIRPSDLSRNYNYSSYSFLVFLPKLLCYFLLQKQKCS